MKQHIHDYFAKHVERAIAGMKEALQAQSFYRRLEMRLVKGEDLSDELPSFSAVGADGALEVVQEALAENHSKVKAVWELPVSVQQIGTQSTNLVLEHAELIPRATIKFCYKCAAGEALVTCQTLNENFSIEISTNAERMAEDIVIQEFFKELSHALLIAQ